MTDHDDDLPPVLERLGAEVERVARLGARHRHRVGPSSRRVLILAAITVVAVAAAAVAATTGLLTGEPVEDPKGVGFGNPTSGLGVALPKTAKLAPPRVADPAGGPPWGVRTLTTTRGLGCVQIGRVQDGQIGVIGQDGAFANDGKFHVMSPAVLSGAQCSAADGAGHAFLAIAYSGLPASTLDRGCLAQAPVPNPRVRLPAASKLPPLCPPADLRLVYYGLLGPQAAAVTYRAEDGTEATQAVAGPEGAYLVVLRPDGRHRLSGGYSIGRSPGSGLLSVRYRDGSVCKIVSPIRQGGARSCPVKGYVAPAGGAPTTAEVRTPVRARVSRTPVEPRFPGVKGHQPKQWKLTVSFRARVATRGAGTYYQLSVVPDHQRVCGFSGLGGPVSRDVKAGSVVTKVDWIPLPCQGKLKVTVVLHQQRDAPDPVPFGGVRGRHDPLVGTATAPIPRR
jgi:hypothetical protein